MMLSHSAAAEIFIETQFWDTHKFCMEVGPWDRHISSNCSHLLRKQPQILSASQWSRQDESAELLWREFIHPFLRYHPAPPWETASLGRHRSLCHRVSLSSQFRSKFLESQVIQFRSGNSLDPTHHRFFKNYAKPASSLPISIHVQQLTQRISYQTCQLVHHPVISGSDGSSILLCWTGF